MSKDLLRDQRIYIDGYELTSRSNTCQIQASKDIKDATTFGTTNREKLSGLRDFTFGAGGFMDPDEADQAIWSGLDGSDFMVTVTPNTPSVGGIAYLMKAVESSIQILGAVGEVSPFQIGAAGNSLMTKGAVMVLPSNAITAAGVSTVQQNSNAGVGKKLKLAIHVLGISGSGTPTITFTLKSSQVVGMTSPTTLITTPAINALSGFYSEAILGAIGTYFQLSWTLTGTTPSFSVMASFSIV